MQSNYGQFMKFIHRGAVRIESTAGSPDCNNVAFRNPDGSLTLVVANTTERARSFAIVCQGKALKTELGAKSIATFVRR